MKLIGMIKGFLYNVLCFFVGLFWAIIVGIAMVIGIGRAMVITFKDRFIQNEPTETE